MNVSDTAWAQWRKKTGRALVDSTWGMLAALGQRLPMAQPERHGVTREKNIAYGPRAIHKLDLYRPANARGPLPVVLYLHGGGFRILSKDTHWAMSLPFAKQGYLVATIDYRLAPKEPFPAAIEDACTALAWVHDNIRAHGGDPSRIVVAGESAGANLTCAVVLTSVVQRPEPWARAVYDREIALRAAVPACGVLQVSDPERFLRRKPGLPAFLNDRLLEVRDAYLTPCTITHDGGRDLADPLCVIESLTSPLARALPPMFAGVGTGDPLLDDTRRLGAALDRLGVKNRTRYYPGEMHAFQAMPWSRHAPAYWAELWEFLAEHVGSARATDADASASIAR